MEKEDAETIANQIIALLANIDLLHSLAIIEFVKAKEEKNKI